ncbi:uncharacterized protein HD556DRAFT_877841 [Suillus plorans]|uniref:LYR motif-containing protein 2 n=1 Tax=Suillus plorans TaxID=116603 RepID=A0A9P7DRK0_9AGAM|nr:uncharacterized protein HD556DRAFT_877841 [Suillus plorans]KAG1801443.1 hypothetical protein HD556DRAFT_877841 [Suillus plorans]
MPNFGLKYFILQQRVIHLYRHAIRASKYIPDPRARSETIAWFRSEIERNKWLTDVAVIEQKITMARREIRQILPTSQLQAL